MVDQKDHRKTNKIFSSDESDLVIGDSNGTDDVFVRDVVLGVTKRVSLDWKGEEVERSSVYPAISADGRFITFQTSAGLVPEDTGYLPEDGDGDIPVVDIPAMSEYSESESLDSNSGFIPNDDVYLTENPLYSPIDGKDDTEPPVVTPPVDITVEATAIETPVSLGAATAVDNVDGSITPTADQNGPFSVGVHTITWSATDSSGNTGNATQTVTVRDTTPPVLTVPADVNVIAAVPATVDIGQATATDIFSVTITNDAPASYPDGTTVVTWTATDANGNVATGVQNVTVQADDDVDGIPNTADNCTQIANTDQRDTNGDGYGNICDADLDNNAVVSSIDLAIFKSSYGSVGQGLDADFNGDNEVNVLDLNIFKTLFGKAPGPSGVAP